MATSMPASAADADALCATPEGRQVVLLRCFLQALEHRQDVRPARGGQQPLVKRGVVHFGGNASLTRFAHAAI